MSAEIDEPQPPGAEYEEAITPPSDPIVLLEWLPKSLSATLRSYWEQDPHLFDMDERPLERHLKDIGQHIGNRDDAIRARFWYVYDLCEYELKRMQAKQIFAGIMSEPTFYTHYVTNRFKMAWMLCKPTELKVQDLASITAFKRKMDDFLRMDARDPVTGKVDVKLFSIQMTIYKNMENRVFGLPTQNIVNKNLNINTEVSQKQMQTELEAKDHATLQAQLQEMKTVGLRQLPISKPDSSSGEPIIVEGKKYEP